jgi:hypothetical protein
MYLTPSVGFRLELELCPQAPGSGSSPGWLRRTSSKVQTRVNLKKKKYSSTVASLETSKPSLASNSFWDAVHPPTLPYLHCNHVCWGLKQLYSPLLLAPVEAAELQSLSRELPSLRQTLCACKSAQTNVVSRNNDVLCCPQQRQLKHLCLIRLIPLSMDWTKFKKIIKKFDLLGI